VEAGQGGVAGGHPGHPQRHDVAHPQDLAQHCAGVRHVLLVSHGGLVGLANHSVDFKLHFLYRKKKNPVLRRFSVRNLGHRHVQQVVKMEIAPFSEVHLSAFGLNEGPISGPTLNVGVCGHVEQSPTDGGCRRLSPS